MRKIKNRGKPKPQNEIQNGDSGSDDWAKNLQTFDTTKLGTIFPAAADAGRNAEIGLSEGKRIARGGTSRQFLHMLHVANAAKQLERLPESGESLHCIMRGNFNGWDLVPAVLQLAQPATIRTLHIATLGFNERNAHELVELLDAGQIGRVWFICSCYFRSTTPDVWDFVYAELKSRGSRAVAIRSHAKILGFELSDGRALTVESSANLRSCHNIEQFTMTNAPELLRFHQSWMDEVISKEPEP